MSMIETTELERKISERISDDITNNLAVSRVSGGLDFANASEVMTFAKMMALSQIGVRKHLRGNVGACLAITVQAVEWGMSPFAVANKSYLVNDQIAYESQLVQAVILRRAPIKGRFQFAYTGEGERRRCTVTATLKDGGVVEYQTPEMGKIPVKNSPLWKSDPDQQLSYYAGRALCRRHFPDVLLGVYDIDELAEAPRDPERARDVTPRTLAARLDALAAEEPEIPGPVAYREPDEAAAESSHSPSDAAAADPQYELAD